MATVKERVLQHLDANRGSYISGEELAADLGVTRAAVWKAINTLRASGWQIDAVPNRGYSLAPDTDLLNADVIRSLLRPEAAVCRPQVFDSLPSTNRTVRELAQQGEREGAVVVAAAQTEGRGRGDHSFFSPTGSGLYMSILLRPAFSAQIASLLTTAAAVAVAKAVEEEVDQECAIKWVNDVLLDDKKICGILTEASVSLESGGLDYVVVGIGLNVAPPIGGWPEELADIAGSVFPSAQAASGMRGRLAAGILNEFWPLYENLSDRSFLPEYRRRLFFLGRQVTVVQGDTRWMARAVDIDENCHLILRRADGTSQTLSGGEIHIQP